MYRPVVDAVIDTARDALRRRPCVAIDLACPPTCRRSAGAPSAWSTEKRRDPFRAMSARLRCDSRTHGAVGGLNGRHDAAQVDRPMSSAADFQSQQLVGDQSLRTKMSLEVIACCFQLTDTFKGEPIVTWMTV